MAKSPECHSFTCEVNAVDSINFLGWLQKFWIHNASNFFGVKSEYKSCGNSASFFAWWALPSI